MDEKFNNLCLERRERSRNKFINFCQGDKSRSGENPQPLPRESKKSRHLLPRWTKAKAEIKLNNPCPGRWRQRHKIQQPLPGERKSIKTTSAQEDRKNQENLCPRIQKQRQRKNETTSPRQKKAKVEIKLNNLCQGDKSRGRKNSTTSA